MLALTLSVMISCASLLMGATAAPVVEPRDVVAPPITYPKEGSIWTVGAHEKVTWDTSDLPPVQNITNKEGKVILGWLDDPNDPYSEHLDLNHPLATGFPITQGTVDVVVPTVEPKDNYIIVLFGDSGNISPRFTIRLAIGGGSSSSAAPSSSTSQAESSATPASTTSAPATTTATPAITTTSAPNTSLPVTVTTVVQTSTTFVPSSTTSPSASAASGLSTSISVSSAPASSTSSSRSTSASSSPSRSGSSSAAQTTTSGAGPKFTVGGWATVVLGAMAAVLVV